jgi:AAA domain (dynein-related subfamily)
MTTTTIPQQANITITLKPSQVAAALVSLVKAGQPTALWGAPGIGKSDIVRQVGASLGMSVIDIRASMLDPVDLRGLPMVQNGRSHWATPEFLPTDGVGILFLDELNRAPTMVQNALFQLVLDRKLGEYELPSGWVVVAACNRETDGGGVQRMAAALANRFVHIDVEPDLDDWCKWAASNSMDPMLIAFMRFRPEYLNRFDPKAKAFPTPRSWSFVSRIVGQHQTPDLELAMVSGTVGQAAAIEFESFARTFRQLPSIDAILLNPATAAVPTDPATCYAVSAALARRATDTNVGRVIQYLDRMPEEFAVYAIKDATARDPMVAKTPEFILWASVHGDVMS